MLAQRARIFLHLAWRDLKAERIRSLLLIAIAALSVAALTAIHGSADAFAEGIRQQTLAEHGGDVAIELYANPTPLQIEFLNRLPQWTTVIFASAAVRSGEAPDPETAIVKAVDPAAYPLYGGVKLEPERPLAAALAGAAVVVSPELLSELGAHVGSELELGGLRCRISAVLVREPDLYTGGFASHLRLLSSIETLERSALLRNGAPSMNRLLLRVPPTGDRQALRARLDDLFPGPSVFEPAGDRPSISATLDKARDFLRLAGWLAFALGAAGTVPAARLHVRSRMGTLTILKLLGGRPADVALWLVLELAMLGAAGASLGVVTGLAAAQGVVWLAGISPAPLAVPLAQVLIAGLLLPLLAGFPAVIACARVRPADLARGRSARFPRFRRWRSPFGRMGALAPVRQALANLARPSLDQSSLFAVMGMMTLFAVMAFAAEEIVAGELLVNSLFTGANIILTAVQDDQLNALRTVLVRHGAEPDYVVNNLIWVRIAGDASQRPRLASCAPGITGAELDSSVAAQLGGLRAGSTLEFQVDETSMRAPVERLRDLSPAERLWSSIVIPCSLVQPRNVFHNIGARVPENRIRELLRQIRAQFPAVTAQTPADMKARFHDTGWTAIVLLRIVAAQVIASGVILMALLMGATIVDRQPILAIYRFLGASSKWVRLMLMTEFALLAAAAGGAGATLGIVALNAVLTAVLRVPVVSPHWTIIAWAGAVALTLGGTAGWMIRGRVAAR